MEVLPRFFCSSLRTPSLTTLPTLSNYGKKQCVSKPRHFWLTQVLHLLNIFTVRGKVMFLHLSVILSIGGVSASVHAGIPPPPGQTPPSADTPWTDPPSRQLLQQMVRILLECILVTISVFFLFCI